MQISRSQPTVRIYIQGRRTDSARSGPPSRACRLASKIPLSPPHRRHRETTPQVFFLLSTQSRGARAQHLHFGVGQSPQALLQDDIHKSMSLPLSCSSSRHASVPPRCARHHRNRRCEHKREKVLQSAPVRYPNTTLAIRALVNNQLLRVIHTWLSLPDSFSIHHDAVEGLRHRLSQETSTTWSYPLGDFEAVPAPIAPYTLNRKKPMNGSTQIPQGISGRYSVPDPSPTAMFVLLVCIFTFGGGHLVLRIELIELPSFLERHTKLPQSILQGLCRGTIRCEPAPPEGQTTRPRTGLAACYVWISSPQELESSASSFPS